MHLMDIGFETTGAIFPNKESTLGVIKNYTQQRDFPAINGTSSWVFILDLEQ
jgi:hypothetical protein